MYLADTNVFLEVILEQERVEECQRFIEENSNQIAISDFSVYSIGIILTRKKRFKDFNEFVSEVLSYIKIVSLPKEKLENISIAVKEKGFDFDDSYQYQVAKEYGLKIVTLDRDFRFLSSEEVLFL